MNNAIANDNQLDGVDASNPQPIELRVWWIPQVPMSPFIYPVPTLEAAQMLCDALAHTIVSSSTTTSSPTIPMPEGHHGGIPNLPAANGKISTPKCQTSTRKLRMPFQISPARLAGDRHTGRLRPAPTAERLKKTGGQITLQQQFIHRVCHETAL
jgi:Superinfection exclusion gene product 17